jgi:hypothetical protein
MDILGTIRSALCQTHVCQAKVGKEDFFANNVANGKHAEKKISNEKLYAVSTDRCGLVTKYVSLISHNNKVKLSCPIWGTIRPKE